MLLMIDNYDSFTYNLVQYFGELGAEVVVKRNDAIRVEEIVQSSPSHIVISPGPGTPDQAGITLEVIRRLSGVVPILGVCLGHQAMGQVFGGQVIRAPTLMHGKTSLIHHHATDLFFNLPSPFNATRYHSLIVEKATFPESLEITAWTGDGLIMGLRHKTMPVYGVQFHPESILTEHGHALLKNFLDPSHWLEGRQTS
ncbi:MAG: aminodeoxychorismate/anthranilate synthase component II [Magnetococcales bacterium]|nr:aminodeoxychorismate/anthranilate synthase component II [Magnetococcales bacterium]MBF0151773.1 aminodeoxychorismate/anthranilate synthase component II [Magnetococcales bacterium]MBF0175044.1 aminodeoxychorismate/anthranilate synthase component II [Magnetococcales bacterium]MBF0348813.1 aminodeoxychorismate/anthranilate synthase component II [Magnetococcales bacterium]